MRATLACTLIDHLQGFLGPSAKPSSWLAATILCAPSFGQSMCPVYPCSAWIGSAPMQAMAIGDLNGDQRPDIAYATFGGNLTLAFNNALGGFVPGPVYSMGSSPSRIFLVDVDVDGDADVVALIDSVSQLVVMQNDGDGTLLAPQGAYCGPSPRSLSWSDIDLDGDVDLAVGNASFPPSVTIMRNEGGGQFLDALIIRVPQRPPAVLLATLNDDLWPDLVVASEPSSGAGSVIIHYNNNGIDFGPSQLIANTSASTLQAVDLDLDRDLDVVLGGSSTGYRLMNDGFGGLTLGGLSPMLGSELMDVGRLDDDVLPDALVLTRADSSTTQLWHLRTLAGATFAPLTLLPAIDNLLALNIGDQNGDGDLDAIMGNISGVTRLENDGDGNFIGERIVVRPFPGFIASLHDFDSDGDLDVFSHLTGSLAFTRNNGNLSFAPAQTILSVPSGAISRMIWSDVDGDGDEDALALYTNGLLRVLKKVAPGQLSPPTAFLAGTGQLAAADFDADGDQDVVATESNLQQIGTAVYLVRNDGQGSFGPIVTVTAGAAPVGVAVTDLNGDGLHDIVTANNGLNGVAGVSVVLNLGPQGGSPVFAAPVVVPTNERPSRVSVGDLNNDESPDVVVQFSHTLSGGGSNKIAVLLNNGRGALGMPAYHSVSPSSENPTLHDVNDDGRLDIINAAEGGGLMWVLFGHGDGTFDTVPHLLVNGISSLAIGDFTGDGGPDVLVTHGSDRLAIMVRQPLFGVFTQPPLNAVEFAGGTLNLSVKTQTTEPATYQWLRDNTILVDDDRVSGATTSSLEIQQLTIDDAGTYRVRLSGSACMIESVGAEVQVLPACAADIAPKEGDGMIDVADLLAVIGQWGPCTKCTADINTDNAVNVSDLLLLIETWGACN